MGKAYSEDQRLRVKSLLEAGRDEETIEKETGVSDRTIRRWKLELERTGRIGKPPESRTGRHRVLTPEVEAALFEHVRGKPEMSVDDMLWWLYDTYKIVVGTRTIRRVFERKGGGVLGGGGGRKGTRRQRGEEEEEEDGVDEGEFSTSPGQVGQYQSPYAPMGAQGGVMEMENQLRQAMQQQAQVPQQQQEQFAGLMDLGGELPEDQETIELQLQQIALKQREVDLKLKLRRLQGAQVTPGGNGSGRKGGSMSTPQSAPSTLYNPNAAVGPTPPKRDSRSKKKIEESKKRTAERQERMLRDLERRSRRRDHLTAEWVQSKDIWPLRAQGLLADLMHNYACYTYAHQNDAVFEQMYRELYSLVDLSKGDWDPAVHDELLRERMKRKMAQLRAKMQKTGEIVGRADGFGGFTKAEGYTGEQAGAAVGDETDIVHDPSLTADLSTQPGAPNLPDDTLQYDPVPPEHQLQQGMQYPNPSMLPTQYPMQMHPHHHHQNMLPYAQMGGGQGPLGHQDNLVM